MTVRRARVRTRRDRDLRLGYTGVAVGAAAFVAALVVTTTVVDVLPDLGTGGVVSSAEQQRVLPGVRVRPQPRTTLTPGGTPAVGRGDGAGVPAPSAPAAGDAPGAGPSEPGAAPDGGPGAGPGPAQPPAAPGPGKPSEPEPEPDGPVSSVLTPLATTAVDALDAASGGATQPLGQAALGLVGAVGDLADGPLGTQRR